MTSKFWRTEPRKNYSDDFKLRIVRLASQPGASVAQIARDNGINDNVIFKWLRLWQNEGRISRRLPATIVPSSSPALLPVEVTSDLAPSDNQLAVSPPGSSLNATSCHVEFRHRKMTLENPLPDLLAILIDDPQIPRPLRQSRYRRPLPGHLPRELNRLEPVETCCPECGSDMDYLNEVSAEQLELAACALKVIRTVRVKKACVKCDRIVEAPALSRPIDRGIAGPGLLARELTSKYCEHTPLYRQTEILARQGVELSRALLSNWMDACCRLMAPLNDALYRYVMDTRKLHTDDTPVPVLSPSRKKTKTGRIWTYVRDSRNAGSSDPPAVRFAYSGV